MICCLFLSMITLAGQVSASDEMRKISVKVELDKTLVPDNSHEWILYVYATKPGARLPLANYKGKLSELPSEIVLLESMYLLPHLTLKQAEQVVIVAKATKSKNPHQKSAEDLIGYSQPITFTSGAHQHVSMAIDQHDKAIEKK